MYKIYEPAPDFCDLRFLLHPQSTATLEHGTRYVVWQTNNHIEFEWLQNILQHQTIKQKMTITDNPNGNRVSQKGSFMHHIYKNN